MKKKNSKKQSIRKVLKKGDLKKIVKENPGHLHFLLLIIAFAGVSLYALMSFFVSTNRYLDSMHAAVISNNLLAIEGISDVPTDCYTCPEPKEHYSECDLLWNNDLCPLSDSDANGDSAGDSQIEEIFTDVPGGHKNAVAIETLYNLGIIQGYSDGTFKPENKINRAELLTVITNAVDADFGGLELKDCFTDVKDEWFSTYICYAKLQGWVNGYQDGSYKPGNPVSKSEAIKIIFEAFNFPICEEVTEKPYPDVEIDDWFAPYACSAKENSIIAVGGMFSPHYQITRGEVVQIIFNVMLYQEKNG